MDLRGARPEGGGQQDSSSILKLEVIGIWIRVSILEMERNGQVGHIFKLELTDVANEVMIVLIH